MKTLYFNSGCENEFIIKRTVEENGPFICIAIGENEKEGRMSDISLDAK